MAQNERIELIPKNQLPALNTSGTKVYEKPNYPDSNSSATRSATKVTSLNDSDNSRKSHRSTGSQTLPRGVPAANSFQLPPINTAQSTFHLRKAGVQVKPVKPVAPIIPVIIY